MLTEYIKLPACVHLIIAMEFCERFCYYGMRTILILYLVEFLNIPENKATSIFHAFIFMCYMSPVVGAIFADGLCGKYRTIITLSFIYMIGCIMLTISATAFVEKIRWMLAMISLVIISIGTGGIKPCVNTFGAEQVPIEKTKMLEAYFAAFYLVINIGSLLSTAISPLLRAEITCFGHDCYAAAFGTMTILMSLAVVAFVSGTKLYKNNGSNLYSVTYVVPCLAIAVFRSIKRTPNPGKHWLYRSSDKYSEHQIYDVKCLLNLFKLFIPIPIFWSLFDQMGSRWTLQALEMDGGFGSISIKPDQMQALNSILVMAFVPAFEAVIYPFFVSKNLLTKPLQRMLWGMFIASISFITAATLQAAIKVNSERSPEAFISAINLHECPIYYNEQILPHLKIHQLPRTTHLSTKFYEPCKNSSLTVTKSSLLGIDLLVFFGTSSGGIQLAKIPTENLPMNEKSWLRLVTAPGLNGTTTVRVRASGVRKLVDLKQPLLPTNYMPLKPQTYEMSLFPDGEELIPISYLHNGARYTVIVYKNMDGKIEAKLINQAEGTALSILWQIPQYVLITIAEVLFAITGMQFVFHEAPKSMKSIVSSGWLMTTAFGNMLVALVIETHLFKNQVLEYLFFAGLMACAGILFHTLSTLYMPFKEDVLTMETLKANGTDMSTE